MVLLTIFRALDKAYLRQDLIGGSSLRLDVLGLAHVQSFGKANSLLPICRRGRIDTTSSTEIATLQNRFTFRTLHGPSQILKADAALLIDVFATLLASQFGDEVFLAYCLILLTLEVGSISEDIISELSLLKTFVLVSSMRRFGD